MTLPLLPRSLVEEVSVLTKLLERLLSVCERLEINSLVVGFRNNDAMVYVDADRMSSGSLTFLLFGVLSLESGFGDLCFFEAGKLGDFVGFWLPS